MQATGSLQSVALPMLDAYVVFTRLGLARQVAFQIDTGADVTTLAHHERAAFPGIDLGVGAPVPVVGPGGTALYGVEPALIRLRDDEAINGWHVVPVDVVIARSADASPSFSLLGRDVLQAGVLTMDIAGEVLTLEVHRAAEAP